MTYDDAIDFLYGQLPVYQRDGASAYKPGLATSRALDDIFGNPHRRYPIIHVAGTNGKGSTSHTLAAVLSRAGYKVGLYTSPHIYDFRERIRVDGRKISVEAIIDFVERWRTLGSKLTPSFFELTSTMAFEYFAKEGVDIAVIETGLGGRLDSTNIVTPALSVITNISLDHTALLGDTLEAIAREKAGIIKPGVPVIIGERDFRTRPVFEEKAHEEGSKLLYAEPLEWTEDCEGMHYPLTPFGELTGELTGDFQAKNAATIVAALSELKQLGFSFSDIAVKEGFANVCRDTGLFGRWTKLSSSPTVIADTGHNIGAWEYIAKRLSELPSDSKIHLIIGFVNDKDISAILKKISEIDRMIKFYFSSPSVPRGLAAGDLALKCEPFGFHGSVIPDVNEALSSARLDAAASDIILIAGSNFLIADLKPCF